MPTTNIGRAVTDLGRAGGRDRRAGQEAASAGLGTGNMSAVNLMEFDSKMNVQ